jgi:hypothetical protein
MPEQPDQLDRFGQTEQRPRPIHQHVQLDDHIIALKQISVFLENRPGVLASVTRTLADAGVNLRALAIAETERFGVLRIVADNTDEAVAALHAAGVVAKLTDVLGIEVPDKAGGLADLLNVFDSEVSIDYMYAELSGRSDRALLIMKLDPLDRALELLRDAGIY